MSNNESFRGLWLVIHRYPLTIKSTNDLRDFERFMIRVRDLLTCNKCRRHYENELTEFQSRLPSTYQNYKTSLFVFKLTVDMHNSVNSRLDKSNMSYIDALNLYDTDSEYKNLIKSNSNKVYSEISYNIQNNTDKRKYKRRDTPIISNNITLSKIPSIPSDYVTNNRPGSNKVITYDTTLIRRFGATNYHSQKFSNLNSDCGCDTNRKNK